MQIVNLFLEEVSRVPVVLLISYHQQTSTQCSQSFAGMVELLLLINSQRVMFLYGQLYTVLSEEKSSMFHFESVFC